MNPVCFFGLLHRLFPVGRLHQAIAAVVLVLVLVVVIITITITITNESREPRRTAMAFQIAMRAQIVLGFILARA